MAIEIGGLMEEHPSKKWWLDGRRPGANTKRGVCRYFDVKMPGTGWDITGL